MEPDTPKALIDTQEWFAGMLRRPLAADHDTPSDLAASGEPAEKESPAYIAPSPSLQSHQRIGLYNQQYWWRFFSVLQETYPFLSRLFGPQDFNSSIAVPYFTKHPSTHWAVGTIGRKLPQWIEEDYHADDKALVLSAAQLDHAFDIGFTAPELPALNAESMAGGALEKILEQRLYLQPHITLLSAPFDIFSAREVFIKESPEYWLKHAFPEMPKDQEYYALVFRTQSNTMKHKLISAGQHRLLSMLQAGKSLQDACEALEKEGGDIYEEALQGIPSWLQEWTIRSWLSAGQR